MTGTSKDGRNRLPGVHEVGFRCNNADLPGGVEVGEQVGLFRDGKISIAGAEPPCKISVRHGFLNLLFCLVADLLNGSICESIHQQGVGHVPFLRAVNQDIYGCSERCRHENRTVAAL